MSSSKHITLEEVTKNLSDYYQPGDYIAPKFNDNGSKIQKGRVFGDKSEVISMSQRIAKHALATGSMLPVTTSEEDSPPIIAPKTTKKKLTKSKPPIKEEQLPTLRIDSDFANSSGVKSSITSAPTIFSQSVDKIINIVFSSKLGKIKVSVEEVLEEETAFCLVFNNEREVRFEPQQGEILDITHAGKKHSIMYPGFLFGYGEKRLMILAKVINE